jgi:hypothetical protein
MSRKIKKNKGSFRIKVIIAVCVVILVIIPSFILFFHNKEMAGLVSYKGDSYTFSYPNDWSISKSAMTNVKGTAFYLQPSNSEPPETPHVIIEVAAANQKNMKTMTDAFTIFKYKKTSTIIDGINALTYTTIVPSSEGVLHSVAYVLTAKGNIYLFKLGYKQKTTDITIEDDFNRIVSTFTPSD